MALDFLGSFSKAAGGLGSIINALTSGSQQRKIIAQASQPTQAELNSQELMNDLLDPNSARMRATSDKEFKTGAEAFMRQLQMLSQQGQRQTARGLKNTFFNPERADETLDYLTTRGLPGVRAKADESARGILTTAATGQRSLIATQASRNDQLVKGMQSQEVQRQANPFGNITGAIGGLQDIFKAFAPQQQARPYQNFMGPMPMDSYFSMFG